MNSTSLNLPELLIDIKNIICLLNLGTLAWVFILTSTALLLCKQESDHSNEVSGPIPRSWFVIVIQGWILISHSENLTEDSFVACSEIASISMYVYFYNSCHSQKCILFINIENNYELLNNLIMAFPEYEF